MDKVTLCFLCFHF